MIIGDLVKPIMSCSGDPGTIRCESAIVIDMVDGLPNYETVEILCKHGTSMRYPKYLEVINESR